MAPEKQSQDLPPSLPRVLTIAGSDSGAGAGIQADLKTFAALSTYGTSVLTALTAQNSLGVQGVHGVPPEFVVQQLDSVLGDIGTDAIKLGMLWSEETIQSITASLVKRYPSPGTDRPPIVLDPVCVSTSGHSLLPASALDALRNVILPISTIITPNVPEAQLLASLPADKPIETLDDMRSTAKVLAKLGARYVLLKGGHMPFVNESGRKVVVDLLWDGREEKEYTFERGYIVSNNTHGTGCTLSSAIAAQLAKGFSMQEAVRTAGDFVAGAIAASYGVGAGAGPVNHFHNIVSRTLPLPNPTSPHPLTDYLIAYNPDAWRRYVHHPFVAGLADGTMPLQSFLHFIQQDYHFLKQYGRSNALAAYKTEDMDEMAASTVIVQAVVKETEMHIGYCAKYGISREELLAVPESVTNIAYTRFVLDTSAKGDLLDTRVVTAPCLIGYGVVGARLVTATEGTDRSENNPYWGWIAEYGGDWYQGAVQTGIDLLESTLAKSPISPQRLKELAKIFVQATELEIAFWDAAVDAAKTA